MNSLYVGDVRQRIKEFEDESFNLHFTSFPYGAIKKYSDSALEIGYGMSQEEYYASLSDVIKEMVRTLKPGCRMVINIGDEFLKAEGKEKYRVLPHSAEIISMVLQNHRSEIDYNGTIRWDKVTTSKTSGGGKIMGSIFTPPNAHFFINHEHIIVFRKKGDTPKSEFTKDSQWTIEQRREWFQDRWKINPTRQNGHIAMFPIELPMRIIQMYSRKQDIVCDVFAGSGTTLCAAKLLDRIGIGFELGFNLKDGDWKDLVLEKYERLTKEKDLIIK